MDSTESIPETPVSNDACSLNQIENEEKIEQEIRSLIQDEEMPLAIETVLNEGTDKMDCTEVEPLDELVGDALNKEEKTPEPNLTANLEEQEQCIDISDKQEHSTAHEDKYEHSVDKQDQSVEDSNKQEPSKGDLDMKECSIENVEPSTEDADKQESSIENSDKQEQPAEDSDKQEQSVEELDKQKHSIEDSDKQEHSVEELDKEKHSVEDSDKEEGSQKQEQPIENSDKQNQPSEDSNKEKEISDEIIKSVEEGVPEQTLAESENSNLETAEEFDKDENQKTDDSMLDTSTTQEKDKSDELGDSHFVECDKTIEDESFSDKNNEQEDVLATTKDILEQGTSSETVFVQVNTETEKLTDDNDVQKDIDFLEQDPIAADSFDHLSEDQEGGSEELCIIPDTERVISQAERDAASSIPPLRDITESNTSSDDESAESVNINIMQYHGDEEQNCSLPKCSSKNIPNYFYEDKSKITKYICDKVCLSSFLSSKPENLRISWDASIVVCGGKAIDKPFIPKPTIYKKRFCQNCKEVTKNMDKLLTWQMMDFCNEECLIKYQKENASMCSSCSKEVLLNCLGKYCVRFGQDIKQFCTSHCLEEYKKGLKLCSYCQKDMSDVTDGFLAPVGDKGQFKDFCGQKCMDKYDTMSNDSPPIKVDSGTKCNVCNSDSPIKFEFEWKSKNYYFCSDPCVTAFSFRNKVETGKCIICKKYTQQEILDKYTAYEDDTPISFCSSSCQNIYIAAHRKIVPCSWCKVKKYFFDMIRNYSKLGALVNLCSINCFNLFQESYCLSEKQSCYICENNTNVLYYLTTKDKSKYNICSYKCVLKFKENFPKENIESTALFNSSKEKTQSRKRSRTEENGENQEEDPIVGITTDNLSETEEGADEEIYIIPDTERIISQAEKDAASSIPPLREISQDITQSNAPVTNLIQPPIYVRKYDKDDPQSCSLPECNVMNRPVKYFYCKEGTTNEYICNDNCLKTFKTLFNERGVTCVWEESNLRVKNFSTGSTPKSSSPSTIANRVCAACAKETKDVENNLTWEIMDFCNEFCLTKYQKEIGSHCASCRCEVRSNSLGKYCVRFGNYIRQFCTSHCLEEYKRGLKVCSYCQQDMSNNSDGFLAPVGDKGQFKDFCSQSCMLKYDIMTNNRPPNVPDGTICSVCKSNKQITIEFEMKGDQNYFCGEPCFIAFRFVNNITTGKCSMCRRYFNQTVLDENTMFYDNTPHSFCSNSCKNIYIVAHRKIVPCSWCKVKKYNFDMIRRYSKSGPQVNMCSVNCLNLYHVSLSAVSAKKQPCHCCNKSSNAMYHLTMSDATVRNFCSYSCVMTFQNQFTKQPITLNLDSPVPAGAPRKNKKSRNDENGPSVASEVPGLPVITNVQSLASTNGNLPNSTQINTRSTRSKTNAMQSQIINNSNDLPVQIQVKQHFIVRPAPMPEQRNVGTLCTIRKANKSCNAKPVMVNKECQTDEREAKKILIPVPVPIYVPTPLHMFTAPVPMPVPFPLPIPIPIFIPTTRNSATGIMKEIKKIQVKIPSDPYEAELLMMAEMVAEEKKEENTDSESDVDDAVPADEGTFSPEPVDASNTFGDDMLQMALKMATELEEPAVDLEGALTANTITAPQGSEPATEESVDDPQPIHHLIDRPSLRGRKRGMRQSRGTGAKRGRRMSHQIDLPLMTSSAQSGPPPEPVEKPDANMCLKFTFGVNAWKQWVTTKNAELEKSSRRVKLFKTDILQLTSDELNYSLCLFVKEVRKPNGAEYAPDTIYYLCLGIQQYLFEHQRIDNIFCDPYYEKFTDCLDEVAKKFSVLYNDSHYIVTRVEEEHLWESKQLGAHSPHVLLSTLMFFNTKHFNLTTVDEHMQLSFSHIMKHWKRNPSQPSKVPGSRNVLLRFYPPQSAIQNNARKKKVYEQQENEDNPLRCPVKLYEFYLSKCPESVKTRNDVFYLQPERSCVPDSPVWYSTMPLPRDALEKMLHRVKMVKEINVALLTS